MKITHWKFSTLRNLFIELHDVKKSGKEEIKIITLDNLEFYLSDDMCYEMSFIVTFIFLDIQTLKLTSL